MRQIQLILLSFMTIYCTSCNNKNINHNSKQSKEVNNNSDHPKEIMLSQMQPLLISQYGIKDAVNQLKWNIYCIYCDVPVELKNNTSLNHNKNVTFGMVEMGLSECYMITDTVISIKFQSYYNKTPIDLFDLKQIPYFGGLINVNNKSLRSYWTVDGAMMMGCELKPNQDSSICPRETYPEHPDALKYIREHKDELAPWFRQEAIKRGVIIE